MSQSKVSFKPSDQAAKPTTSKQGKACPKLSGQPKLKFQLPALSIRPRAPPLDPALERLKRKTIRRNAPEGEDLKKIKEVIKTTNKEVIKVQEFVGLVSPYTGDNGNILRSVMGDDLARFRSMATRVYNTMTQDVSDVLANEQIHLTDFYNERYQLLMDKMMRSIHQIFNYVPNFNFEKFYLHPEYLDKLFPLPADNQIEDPEEVEMQRRQEAYHRLQWLRSEGERLNEENTKLQARLKQLKKQQKDEITESKRQEEMAELKKNQLEATQTQLQNKLEELNESLEKSIIVNEEELRMQQDSKLSKRPPTRGRTKTRRKVSEPWNVKAAKSIEEQALQQSTDKAISSISTSTIASKSGTMTKKKARPKLKKALASEERDTSPFHYSPPRDLSPFHYSPPTTPPEAAAVTETYKVESTTVVTEEAPPEMATGRAPYRRNLAPKDSWQGFR